MPDRPVHGRRWLLIGELILITQLCFQSVKLILQPGDEVLLRRVAVDVVQFVRVLHEVVELPLVLLPEVDQLMCCGAYAVMRAGIVIAWIVVVASFDGVATPTLCFD